MTKAGLKRFLDKVVFTEDLNVIKDVLSKHSDTAQRNLSFALASLPLKIPSLPMNRI